MNKIMKKVTVFSMIGLMQVGLGVSVIEAAPFQPGSHRLEQQQRDDRHRQEQERNHRIKAENERHEREMKRRPHESKKDWHERQKKEKERHQNAIRDIAALLISRSQ